MRRSFGGDDGSGQRQRCKTGGAGRLRGLGSVGKPELVNEPDHDGVVCGEFGSGSRGG